MRAKDDRGLDRCKARSWHGWRHHMKLSWPPLLFGSSSQRIRGEMLATNGTNGATGGDHIEGLA